MRLATAACMQKYGNVSFATVACAKCMRYGGGGPYHGGKNVERDGSGMKLGCMLPVMVLCLSSILVPHLCRFFLGCFWGFLLSNFSSYPYFFFRTFSSLS